MAQVPNYNPVPESRPSGQALPQVSINAPVEAFGGATAGAMQGLGRTIQGVGDELYARANALQQLKNETDAKDQDVQFMVAAGEIHAQYNALQGSERVAAFPKYSQGLQDLYRDHRERLGNPQAQKMFDASAVSTLSRSIFNGAGAAATAQKEAAHTAVLAKWDQQNKGAFNGDPLDVSPAAMQKLFNDAVTLAETQPGGSSPEVVDSLMAKALSERAMHKVLGTAAQDPLKASQMFDDFKAKGLLLAPQAEVLERKVQALAETKGTDDLANGILQRYRTEEGYSKSVAEMRDEAVVTAKELYPNDPKIATAAQHVFERNYADYERVKKFDQSTRTNTLNGFLAKGVMQVNQLPQDLVLTMTPKEIHDFPIKAAQWRQNTDKISNDAARNVIQGLMIEDKGRFMSVDVASVPGLSNKDKLHFIELQRKTGAKDDPRVSKAFNAIVNARGTTLQSLGVVGESKNETTQLQFKGALHEALQAWQETHTKPPSDKELMEQIYPALIMNVTDKSKFSLGGLLNRTTEFFKLPLDNPEKAKIAAEADAGRSLNDDEVRSHVMLKRFKELYGSSKSKPSKDQGRVGQ